jgi:hypothetical protein
MLNSISRYKQKLRLVMLLLILLSATAAFAQTTGFTYQGRLTDGGTPANGTYDLQFKLFDMVTGGTQQPQPTPITVERTGVQVSSGIFTVPLDFGANAFPGGDRYLEIAVRHNSGESYTLLSTRQQITSTPYSLRSLNAATADTSTNATQLGGVAANQYVQTNDSRLSDARPPTPGSSNYLQNTTSQQSAANFNISGDGMAGGTLSGDVINATTQYNLGGSRVLAETGTSLFVGGSSGFNITTGQNNSFFGIASGLSNTTGSLNSFFGYQAGTNNAAGNFNSFFGYQAGKNSTSGANSFFGTTAGLSNTSGFGNSFFGYGAGLHNLTASNNSFFGDQAGSANTTGDSNSFFGSNAGQANTTGRGNASFGTDASGSNTSGNYNSAFGLTAGYRNTTGAQNSFFGQQAGYFNITGTGNTMVGYAAGQSNTAENNNTFIGSLANGAAGITNATAIGVNALVTQSNSLVLGNGVNVGIGTSAPGQKLEVAGNVKVSGTGNGFLFSDGTSMTTAGLTTVQGDVRYAQLAAANNFNGDQSIMGDVSATGAINANTQYNIGGGRVLSVGGSFNLFLGFGTGASNTSGFGNSFFGFQAGATNDIGTANSFFGYQSGNKNSNGNSNSFFGSSAGANNTSGGSNSFFGSGAGANNLTGEQNSFFGSAAGLSNTASGNSFFGSSAGLNNVNGFDNSFFGKEAGQFNSTGISNSFFGARAGSANTSGQSNSFFGWSAGRGNQDGNQNSFFGYFAGFKNLNGSSNSFFGFSAGNNNTSGSINSFFGPSAGSNNTSGTGNTFLGSAAGLANTIENDNTFIGHSANGAATITNATAIGANASVTQSNSLVLGSINGQNFATADTNVGIGTTAPTQRLEVAGNVKVSGTGNGFIFSDGSSMTSAGLTTTSGDVRYAQLAAANSFNGNQSVTGTISATGAVNAGTQYNIAGNRVMSNTGTENMFVGLGAGNANSGSFGSFFGNNAGQHNTSGDGNSFFGDGAGQINITGQYNSFFGTNAGQNNSGSYNSFFGALAGQSNLGGSGNTVVGELAGLSNSSENNNTFIGYQANGAAGITNATAIGANASVTQSNSVVLGNNVNVGIGPTSPLAKLDIQGGADSDGAFDPKAIALSYRNGGYRHWIRTRHNSAGGGAGNAIDFFTNTAGSAGGSSAPGVGNQLVMSLNGSNVGVGTNDPKAKLHVQGGNIFVAQPNSLIITSPNGACWQIRVSDLGVLTAASVMCPN